MPLYPLHTHPPTTTANNNHKQTTHLPSHSPPPQKITNKTGLAEVEVGPAGLDAHVAAKMLRGQ